MLKRKLVVVGSINPVKVRAVEKALNMMWSEICWTVSGIKIASGVSAQPMSDKESIKGATNRAKLALASDKRAEFGVGIEGGLQNIGENWFDSGWCVVVNKKKQIGIGSSARIETPKLMINKISAGRELGEIIDEMFKVKNAKQNNGHFGLMTNNVITRIDGYIPAVCFALSRFLHPQLFD